MLKRVVFIIQILLFVNNSFAQNDHSELLYLAPKNLNGFYHKLKTIQRLASPEISNHFQQMDLVIGDSDPNETLTIEGSFFLHGNLIIVNNGVLNLQQADFHIDGDITVMGRGQLNVNGGRFTVMQEYIYEHEAIVLQGGSLRFSGVDFRSSGQSWSVALVDSSQYLLQDSQISDGFITTALLAKSRAQVVNTHLPGEFLCFGENDLQFNNSDSLIFWLVLPQESVVDTELPSDSLLVNWRFSEAEAGVSGIPYATRIDSCTNVLWGAISVSGSDATFRNSNLRALGLLFRQPDSIVVKNITNGSFYMDELVAVPDRKFRLVNSEVQTWNFYPSARSRVTLQNCVFGELISQDSSQVFIDNSVCDGSGGYLGAFQNSFLIVFRTLVNTQVIARNSAVLLGALSACLGPEIDADEFAVMALLNTARFAEPQAYSAAIIFEGLMQPVEGTVDSRVAVEGTARLLAGPLNPVQFQGYQVEYSTILPEPVWRATDGRHPQPVLDDTLSLWNTANLIPGNYALRLSLFHSLGEPIAFESPARLDLATNAEENAYDQPERFFLEQNYPNPFNPVTQIRYQLPVAAHVKLTVFDLLGKEVQVLVDEIQQPGRKQVQFDASGLASGIYYYQLRTTDFNSKRRMLLIK